MKNHTPMNSIENTRALLLRKVMADQIAFLYANLLLSTTTSLIMFSFVFITIFQINYSTDILIWYGCVILVTLFRLGLLYIFRYHRQSNQFHLNIFLIGVAISALLWGLADSYFMPQDDLLRQVIIVIIIAGVTAGATQTLYSNFISSIIYSVIVMLPLIIWLFIQDTFDYFILGICMIAYLGFLLISARRSYSLFESKLKLYYENIELVENLAEKTIKMQKSYLSFMDSEERFHSLMQSSPTGTAIADLKGHFIEVNDALCHFFGYSKQELLQKNFQELTYPEDLPKEMKLFEDLIHNKIPYYQIDKRHIHKDGHLIWTLLTVTGLKSASGKVEQTTGQLQDITERKNFEEKIATANKALMQTLSELKLREHEQSLIIKLNDMLLTCTNCTEAYSRIGLIAQQLFTKVSGALVINNGNQVMEIVSHWGENNILKQQFHPSDCFALRSGNTIIVNDPKENVPCPHYMTYPQGGYICMPLIAHGKTLGGLYLFAEKGQRIPKNIKNVANILGDIIKITIANIKLLELLEDQSIHDPLTGLYNRRYLNESLPHELERIERNKGKLCIAMLDLDLFKNFNDLYGHEAGDEVLKFIGLTLKNKFRGSDVACRFGGEEFLIIIADVDITHAFPRLEDIRNAIKNSKVFYQNLQLPAVTISIGVAEAPRDGRVQDDIISAADQALYVAKKSGRDRVEIFREAEKKS